MQLLDPLNLLGKYYDPLCCILHLNLLLKLLGERVKLDLEFVAYHLQTGHQVQSERVSIDYLIRRVLKGLKEDLLGRDVLDDESLDLDSPAVDEVLPLEWVSEEVDC